MRERKGAITFKGGPLTLLGEAVNVGSPGPDAVLIGNDLSEVRLSDHAGKVRVLSSVPSLDTPVCAAQTRRFNESAAALGGGVAVLTISMDLPFAQQRWCGAEGIDQVITLSDHRDAAFGTAYGVLIKELRLLARAVHVLDAEGTIRYVQLVEEVTNEPDYDEVLAAVKECAGR